MFKALFLEISTISSNSPIHEFTVEVQHAELLAQLK